MYHVTVLLWYTRSSTTVQKAPASGSDVPGNRRKTLKEPVALCHWGRVGYSTCIGRLDTLYREHRLWDLYDKEVLLLPTPGSVVEALEDAEIVVDVHDALPPHALDSKPQGKPPHLNNPSVHLARCKQGQTNAPSPTTFEARRAVSRTLSPHLSSLTRAISSRHLTVTLKSFGVALFASTASYSPNACTLTSSPRTSAELVTVLLTVS